MFKLLPLEACLLSPVCNFSFQKARLARIQIAKATSGAAFVAKKRAAEARLAAQEAGINLDDDVNENIFELQHHHLLRCLEKTTVSQEKTFNLNLKLWVEMRRK